MSVQHEERFLALGDVSQIRTIRFLHYAPMTRSPSGLVLFLHTRPSNLYTKLDVRRCHATSRKESTVALRFHCAC
jgi:hypothetical protein